MLHQALAILFSWAFLLPAHAAGPLQAKPFTPAPACSEGATRCDQNRFQHCQDGRWTTLQTCSAGQRCTDKEGCVAAVIQRPSATEPGLPAKGAPPAVTRQAPAIMAPGVPPPRGGARRLICPSVPNNPVSLPPPPYDEARGDCALRGKASQIETWLSALEGIAATCQARRAGYWQATLDSQRNLRNQIDGLPLAPAEAQQYVQPACPAYPGGMEPSEPSEPSPREGWHYTEWLKRIGKDVVKYCGLVDRLIEPMNKACDEINFYLGCQLTTEATKASYRSLLDGKRNAAQLRYDYTEFFYANTLRQYGWGNFRAYFNESAIRCDMEAPRLQRQAPPPSQR